MLKELNLPFYIEGQEIFTTASAGITISSEEYERPEDMIRDADIAMYQAKAKGKDYYEFFDPLMYAKTLTLLHLETDLRRAIERNQFQMHYQPVVELDTEEVIGFEALIRWNHPERGLICPLEFIPLAEETGLILSMGEWIINECCRQLHEWQMQFPQYSVMKMSVNISTKQFLQTNLADMIKEILERNCVDACCLSLEITESMIMENDEHALVVLKKLQEMGIHIHIDDFGTGYSSLGYLHRFPINALKIDRSFIEKMFGSDENMEIIKTIVSLAQNLKLDLIAEGIEFKDQLNCLKSLKCRYGQGFLLLRPMQAKDIEAWLEKRAPNIAGDNPESLLKTSRI
ncbi:MAG: GGDEF domain-containing phosphodiesterase [Nitrospirota bacterium]